MKIYIQKKLLKIKQASTRFKVLIGIILFLYVSVVAMSVIRINYVVTTPGPINSVQSVIDVESDNEPGLVYTVSVIQHYRISFLQYLVAQTANDISLREYDPSDQIPRRIDMIQGEIRKEVSVINSIIMAYDEAKKYHPNIEINYELEGYAIFELLSGADQQMKIKDIITHVNGTKVTSGAHLEQLITNNTGDTVNLTVRRGKEILDINPELKNNRLGVNIYSFPYYKIKSSTPSFRINQASSRGPSGGLMQAIAVYNAITPTDITKGKIIMGTGTINLDGSVGIIGGVKQKVIAANIYHADYFFVPELNYPDALAQYKLLSNPSYPEPIAVSDFSQAIAFLEGMSG